MPGGDDPTNQMGLKTDIYSIRLIAFIIPFEIWMVSGYEGILYTAGWGLVALLAFTYLVKTRPTEPASQKTAYLSHSITRAVYGVTGLLSFVVMILQFI